MEENLIDIKTAYAEDQSGYKLIHGMIDNDFGQVNWSDDSYLNIRKYLTMKLQRTVESWDFESNLGFEDTNGNIVWINGDFVACYFGNGEYEYFGNETYDEIKAMNDHHKTVEYRLGFLDDLGYMYDTEKNELVNVY